METQWFPMSKDVQDTEVIKQGDDICLLEQRCNFAYRLVGKMCNHHGKVLCCTSRQTEAATSLQMMKQAFEKNCV
jgi:hypothetical protein